jgi:orotidine-5'-phosphate decarboxylase
MQGKRNARERLIVALDCSTQAKALNLVSELGDEVTFYKVGWRLFLQGGLDLVEDIRSQGKDVFLDLKMDDIPETIETAVREIADKAMFLTLQGGSATARAAIAGRGGSAFPKFLQVTLLSSMDQGDLDEVYGEGAPCLEEFVVRRAQNSINAGCEGLIASGQTIRPLREKLGPSPILVCPGIRPGGAALGDQKRPATPRQALLSGADFLVVGRPIHAAADPMGAALKILEEMDAALADIS